MLANNICDVEHDIQVKRYTLPYYLGRKASLWLFAGIYYATYLAVIIMAALKILSPICLLALVSLIPVQKNINTFFREQVKSRTFVTSIKNFIIIMGTDSALIFLSALVR